MKLSLLLLPPVIAAAMAFGADDSSVTGKWKVHNSVVGNESEVDCAFAQKGSDLTGSCATEKGDAKASGKVEGAKINWSYQAEYNGSALTLKYSGTVEPGSARIAGTVRVEEYGVDGDFTATLSK